MLCADLVPRSDNAALQQREGVLDCVGMNVSVNINSVTMANGFVLSALDASSDHRFGVAGVFVSDHNFNVFTDGLFDVFRQCPRLDIARMEETKFAAALPESDHDFF